MKRKVNIVMVSLFMMILSSCEGPDALVINLVQKDGSVTRKIILTYNKDEFDLNNCQVPVDSTWDISRTYDVSADGDTTYTLTAIREFESVKDINVLYNEYEGSNPGLKRTAEFQRKFRWFNTVYHYIEHVDRALEGIPPKDFFTGEEINYFYMPEKLVNAAIEGPDSTYLKESVMKPLEEKTEQWLGRSLVRAFVNKIIDTVSVNPQIKIDTGQIYLKEERIAASILFNEMEEQQVIDSLLGSGVYSANSALNDTLLSEIEDEFSVALNTDSYLIQTIMPGELTATNGYIDEDGNVLWEVKGDVILSSDYDMWAESKIVNLWAWIVTGAFLLFVIAGLIVRALRR
ncbi:MAG: hypothetical protein JW965_07360 [Bacteroidales bacterium]|nr:hypothetical protein [Bacteroidales bacterium]